ncbi:MAG: hypothetical protein ABL973_00065 [Micropepsaceae bacterium]
MPFIPDDDVIEAFAPNRSDDAFCISVLPGAARRNWSVTNAKGFKTSSEYVTELRVVVTDQEPGSRVPGAGFVDLLGQMLRSAPPKHGMFMTEPNDFCIQRSAGSKEVAEGEEDIGE